MPFIMKPDQPGIWEWFDEDGAKRLVEVFNVMDKCPNAAPYLRVYWWGGYYNINDEHDPEAPEYDHHMKAEWPDRWGSRIGDNNSLPENQLYLMPTEAELVKIREE